MNLAGVAFVVAIFALAAPARAENCVAAGVEANASGTLASEGGAYILTTGTPVCVSGPDELDNVSATTRLQVFPGTEPVQAALEGLAGKPVAIKGNFYGSRGKRANAPIFVEVMEAAAN